LTRRILFVTDQRAIHAEHDDLVRERRGGADQFDRRIFGGVRILEAGVVNLAARIDAVPRVRTVWRGEGMGGAGAADRLGHGQRPLNPF
jgi:hypothetical protein